MSISCKMSLITRSTFMTSRNSIKFSSSLFNNYIHNHMQISANSSRLYSTIPEKSKLRMFFDAYGKLGIGVYLGISVVSVSSFYTAIKLGVDLNSLLEKFNLQDNKLVSKAGPFALAYGIHKLFAPVRLLLAFVITPIIKKRFF